MLCGWQRVVAVVAALQEEELTKEGCGARVNRTRCYSEDYAGHPVEAVELYIVRSFPVF